MTVPTLVFLHAASYSKAMWLPQMQALAGEFPLLALDLPGHGELASVPFTLNGAVDTVLRAMDDAGIERADQVGASLGGCVGMLVAGREPHRVQGLVLAGATFNPCRPVAQAVLTSEAVVFGWGGRRFTRRREAWVRAQFPAAVAEGIVAGGAYWAGAAQAVRALRGADFRARLAGYGGRVLIANGAQDWVHRSSEAEFARVAQCAQVVVIPGAGHVPSLEAAGVFTEALREFMGVGE